jgi:dipeptide/tripeptide permease
VSTVGKAADTGARRERTFFGQPWPLANLFGVEMWEPLSGSLAEYYSPQNEVRYFGIIGGVAIMIGVVLAAIMIARAQADVGVRLPANAEWCRTGHPRST